MLKKPLALTLTLPIYVPHFTPFVTIAFTMSPVWRVYFKLWGNYSALISSLK